MGLEKGHKTITVGRTCELCCCGTDKLADSVWVYLRLTGSVRYLPGTTA